MSPPFAHAKITLGCPLYAADFDPENHGFLLVGGGGGEGRSGTLLNTSKKHEVSEVVDIDLSRDEDSVTSLAYAQSTELWATAFAGINSSMREQEQGRNEHLRSFLLEYPPRRRITAGEADAAPEEPSGHKGQTKALGRVSYFTSTAKSKPETFQRVIRLSKRRKENGPRLGAIATGLAPEGEVVVFAADTSSPSVKDIRGRIRLGHKEEAADVDVIGVSDNKEDEANFQIAYCTDYDIFVTKCNYHYNRSENLDPQCIHSNPFPDVFASSKARPKFRSLRFLTPTILLILQNVPNGAGSEILLMETTGRILLSKRLHKKIKSGIALSVAALPFTSPSAKARKQLQHAIAVAGADISITVLTLDHPLVAPYANLQFRPHLFLPSVHPTSITSLTFSSHNPPSTLWTQTPPQYLKLASTSIANTCIVHTLPLTSYPPPKKGPDTTANYVLTIPGAKSNITQTTFSVLAALIAIAIGAFFLQAFTEIRGASPDMIGAKGWLNERLHGWLARPYMFEDAIPTASSSVQSVAQTPLSMASGAFETAIESFYAAVGEAEETISTTSEKIQEDAQTPFSVASEAAETPIEAFYGAMGEAGAKASEARGKVSEVGESAKASAGKVSETGRKASETAEATAEKLGLRDILRQRNTGSDTSDLGNDGKEVIVHHTPEEDGESSLSAEKHDSETLAEKHSHAKRWEDMGRREREAWKRRLLDAGEWAVDEGESVLKGVFFSGLGAAVGAAVGG
ncbi:MAG: hypothetical protein Q9164_005929 [Protoblastenia rupestris]